MSRDSKAAKKKSQGDKVSFEDALNRLEEIVGELEEGEKGLEESIRLYEEGRRLVRFCTERLDEAQTRIEKLVRTDRGLEIEGAELESDPEEVDGEVESSKKDWGENDLPF